MGQVIEGLSLLETSILLAAPDSEDACAERRVRSARETVATWQAASDCPAELRERLLYRARVAISRLRDGSDERSELEQELAPKEKTVRKWVYVELDPTLHAALKDAAGSKGMAAFVRELIR